MGGTVGSSQIWNRYSYVRNKPLNCFDPNGRDVYYATEKLQRFYEKAAKRNWRVRRTLSLYGPGSGRDLYIKIGKTGTRKTGTLRAGYFKPLEAVHTATTKEMQAAWDDAKANNKDPDAAAVKVHKDSLKITKAEIVLTPTATNFQKLHELGHADHAANDPIGYEEAAQEAAEMDDDAYKQSPSEDYADTYAYEAEKKEPDEPQSQ
jgi:hypothetical protein